MAARLKELRENRAKLGTEIKRMADTLTGDKKDFTAEERTNWENLNKDFDNLGRQIEVESRAEEVGASLSHGTEAEFKRAKDERRNGKPGAEDILGEIRGKDRVEKMKRAHGLALQAFCQGGPKTREQRAAAKLLGIDVRGKEIDLGLSQRFEHRDGLGVASAGVGGTTVPTDLMANLEKSMLAFGGARQVADIIRTASGNPLDWPTATDTSNTGELLAENTAVADADAVPTFSKQTWSAYKFSSKMVNVAYELIEDSIFNLESELGAMLGERLGRIQATYFATGTGTSQPAGIVTGSTLGKTAASATAIAADELIDLVHSVDTAYRTDPSVAFMMHDSVLLAIRKLKDGQNNYLWQMGDFQAGVPDRLLGYPVYINHAMASSITNSAKTVLFGAMRYFKIRDVNAIRLRRLEELKAAKDQVAFIAFLRSDSKVLNAGGNPIKHLIQLA